MKRRDVILGGGLVAMAAGWQLYGVRVPQIGWQDVPGLPGWRHGLAGQISGAADPLFAAMPDAERVPPLPANAVAAAVFRGARARVAVFSDHFCPYCRVLFARLLGAPYEIVWHELPLLRPESHIAARAAEAARLQGGYEAFQVALIEQGFRPVPAWLGRLADQAGLDGARLQKDMSGAKVTAGLRLSAGAAASLGIFATPGIVVDRSVILGAVTEEQIAALLSEG